MKTFPGALQCPPTVSGKEPPSLISLGIYRESWKLVKENMSSQGPHIRLHKAAAQHHLLGSIFHQKYDITYLSVYSLHWHSTVTDVMLLKNRLMVCTRHFHHILLESESNHTYTYVGREVMRAAIDYGQIDLEQYDRPHRSAVDHGINRRLVFFINNISDKIST